MVTLNYVLPGLLEHYGYVNKEMNIFCQIKEIAVQEYLYWKREVMLNGMLVCDLEVIGQNLDGSNQLALTFVMPNASVNGTVGHSVIAGMPYMNLVLKKVTTAELYTTNSTFGPVNDLML